MKLTTKLGIGALATAAAGWMFVDNRMLSVDKPEVKVKGLPAAFDGKKILHLSDLHRKRYGDRFNNLINTCAFLKPDYVFFTGDVMTRHETDLSPKLVFMKRLMSLGPVYFVPGNHETGAPDGRGHRLCREIEELGVHMLINRSEKITAGGESVNIYGVELPATHYYSDRGFRDLTPVTADMLREYVGEPEQGRTNILLAHDPLPFEAYAEWGADLVFSGHIHGGIIRLPFVGGLLSPERKFFPKYSKGLYKSGDSQIVVSAGLGKFRMMNPSHILLVTLRQG